MEKEYCYCSVQPKGMESRYSYIADDDMEIRIGSLVEVPFGPDNRLIKGIVVDFGYYTDENAPWPVEKTKRIARVLSREEYLSDNEDTDREQTIEGESAAKEEAAGLSNADKAEIAEAMGYILSSDYDAMFRWAENHRNRVDSPGIMKVVCSCYQLCVEQNNTVAAQNLGMLYYTGSGVPQDFQKAAELFEIAAAAGEEGAICNLGFCYFYGRHQEADYAKAFQCFNLGAVLHDDPRCLYMLGDMYKEGLFVKANGKYAFQLYLRAIQQLNMPNADQSCAPDIQYRLGRELLEAETVEQNPDNALALLMEALAGFYARRRQDPFAAVNIQKTKDLIRKAEKILDEDI